MTPTSFTSTQTRVSTSPKPCPLPRSDNVALAAFLFLGEVWLWGCEKLGLDTPRERMELPATLLSFLGGGVEWLIIESGGRSVVEINGLVGTLENGEGDRVVRVLTVPSLSETEAGALRFFERTDGWECEGVTGLGLVLDFGLGWRLGDGNELSVCFNGEARNLPLAL